MLYDNTELRILEQVYLKPGIHMRALSKQLKLSMPSIDYALKKINGLLKKEKSGNQIKFYVDYSKDTITPSLYSIEYSRFKKLPYKTRLAITDFLRELKEKPVMIMIFGSYAKGNYTKDSDIDIFLVFQKIRDTKAIENTAKRVSMKTNTKLAPIYLDYDAFRESFHNSSKKFFKDLKKDKILLAGIEWWRLLENEET